MDPNTPPSNGKPTDPAYRAAIITKLRSEANKRAALTPIGLAAQALEAHPEALPPAPPPFEVRGRTAAQILAEVPQTPNWLIPGVIARGWVIKVAAREKAGKGTLVFHLVGALERGEPTVFGPAACPPATWLIYTEEPQDSLREKIDDARLEGSRVVQNFDLSGQYFPTWESKVDYLVELAKHEGHVGIFADNISRASGAEDENGTELARKAEYLADAIKAANLSGILDHHHRKSGGKVEDKSRGGTALAGAMDNNIDLEVEGGHDSRVRVVSSKGRLAATLWQRKIALSEDRRSYQEVAGEDDPQTVTERRRLEALKGAGDAGVGYGEYAKLIDASEATARRQLQDFADQGWAERIGERPARYRYHALPDIGDES